MVRVAPYRAIASHWPRPRIGSFGLRGCRFNISLSPSPIARAKAGNTSGTAFQKQYLQWKKRQWQSGDHRNADDQNLSQIAGQKVSREAADIAKDDPSVPDRLNDCREGVVQQDHRSRFPSDIGARKSIATPISACRSAGASLTPSPVTATISPEAWRNEQGPVSPLG